MTNIEFESINIKNFLSVGNEPVTINFREGLHIITGVNKDKEDRRNGVGKSTIADAIYFAIFGDTLRDLKREYIVNNVNKKGCEVDLKVTIKDSCKEAKQLRIVRTLEPSKCVLYINGEDETRDSISNTTNSILKELSCTPEIFQNCIIMTVNNTIPFMAKKKQEKRKFIEDIFNLSVFGDMLKLLKDDISKKNADFNIETTRREECERVIDIHEKQKAEFIKEREKKHCKYVQRLKDNKQELLEIEERLKKIKDVNVAVMENNILLLKNANSDLNKSLQKNQQLRAEAVFNIKQMQKQFESIGTDKDVCYVCLRRVEDKDRDHIKNEKKKIRQSIDSIANDVREILNKERDTQDKIEKIDNKIIEIRSKIHSHELNQQNKNNLIQREKQLLLWQSTLDQDIKELEVSTQFTDKTLDDQRERKKLLKQKVDDIKKDLCILDIVKFVVSEEGIKAYIVKKILKLFNNKLSYYLQKMDANCTLSFNEYFEEEIIDDKGKPCSYFNFSGAERKNIDLACLFAFIDIRRLQGNVSFNFSIYDELFDSSLDERGVELVINILKERVEKFKECIMVISHRRESIKAATGDIIFLEKSNNITRRVDFEDAVS